MQDKYEFRAEVKKLLDILSKSLYQHKEIFLRELISNASDALKKMHFISLQNKDIANPDLPLEVEIIINSDQKTITIRDSGLGMTKQELIDDLGTIGFSGTERFINAIKE
ncbi:MAG TPA: molecular chaperone HtpG, partial [Candidatus Lokiarchaeia archaeon]